MTRTFSRNIWRGAIFSVALMMLAIAVAPTGSLAAPDNPQLLRSNRIHWLNGDYFLSGVNYPFYRYYGGDIATLTNRDSSGNVITESSFDAAAIERDFATMEAGGVNTLRWFLYGDGRGAPEFDDQGRITGVDADFFDHMDQVLDIAHRHNIYIIWSLWDFLAFKQTRWLCNSNATVESLMGARAMQLPDGMREQYEMHLRLAAHKEAFDSQGDLKELVGKDSADAGDFCFVNGGGHANMVTDTSEGGVQDTLFANALIPMFQRYANNTNVIGWEIMNEPEWVVNDVARMGQYPTVEQPVALEPLRHFFQRFTDAVHTYAPGQLATVGSASLKWMGAEPFLPDNTNVWAGLGFDYYGVHYYGWMESQYNHYSPLQRNYSTDPDMQRLDAPVVVGEFPINGGSPPIYLPSIRRSGSEVSTVNLRYICTSFLQGGDPPCTRPYTAIIEYYSPGGHLDAAQTVSLQPNGTWSGPAPSLAGNWTGSARVIANGPVAAQVTVDGIANAAESVAYVGQDRGANRLYLPLVLNQANHHRTRIALQNTSVETATVTLNYYNRDGSVSSTEPTITLAPRGMTIIDPELSVAAQARKSDKAGKTEGTQTAPGFAGSASVDSDRALVGVVYELDPTAGSDAYAAVPEGYTNVLNVPSVINQGANGKPTLVLMNARNAAATANLTFYDENGAGLAYDPADTLNMAPNSSVALDLSGRLPAGFDGSVVVNSNSYMAAVVRSEATANGENTLTLYAGHPDTADRFHFPAVSAGANGQYTTLTAQNTNPRQTITIVTTFNSVTGASTPYTTTIPPLGSVDIRAADHVPANFSGSAEILWPWPSATGWSEGFPLLAVARTLENPLVEGQSIMGVVSHAYNWAVTPYTPREILEGTLANNWAGAMGWSFYDGGTGQWDDFAAASLAFKQAHPDVVTIVPGGGGNPTATPTQTAAPATTPTATPEPGGCQINFSDVHEDQYFYEPVRELFCAGVISGYTDGTFRPFANATRGQLAKIVSLSHGWQIVTTGGPHFSDVPTTNTFYPWIETAYNRGVISGYADGTFRWGNNITRGQLSKIIVKAAEWELVNPATPSFVDVSPSNAFYKEIETAVQHGIISGYDAANGTREFRWTLNATRGQIAKIVYQSLHN